VYCMECGLVCKNCLENHRIMKALSHHSILPLSELETKMESLDFEEDSSSTKCEKHINEMATMYCYSCHRLVCSNCVPSLHPESSHMVRSIADSAKRMRNEFQKMAESAKMSHDSLTERGKSALDSHTTISAQRQAMKDSIASNFKILQNHLESVQKIYTSHIDSIASTALRKLSQEIDFCSAQAESALRFSEVTQEAISITGDCELLTLKTILKTRLKEISAKKLSTSEIQSSACIETSTTLSSELMQSVCSHIQHHISPSLENSHATGPGVRTASVGKETSFTVHAITDAGQPCFEKLQIEVDLRLARTSETLPCTVTPSKKMGDFIVTYVPTCKGELLISVRIEGNLLKSCPYSVIARGLIDPWMAKLVIEKQEWPWGVACSANREIYISRNYQHTVAVFNREGQYLRKIGVKGQGQGALWHPTGVAVDEEENVFVADGNENGRIQKFSKNGQLLAIYSKLKSPQGVIMSRDYKNVYVCDKGHQSVVMLDKDLNEILVFGELDSFETKDGFQDVSGHLVAPHTLAESQEGTIFVSDTHNIHIFTKDGKHLRKIKYSNFAPSGIAIDGELLYVCDMMKHCILVFTTNGKFVGTRANYGKLTGQFHTPTCLAFDCDGFLCVTDYSNHRVQVF